MRLYVGNLSFQTNEDRLRVAFEAFGNVADVVIIRDRETGRSRGFGFVDFSSEDEGRVAAEAMNGKEVDGRALKVNEARPREGGERGERSGGGFGRGRR